MRQFILDIRPDAAPTLDNFLPGPNAEALAVLRAHTGEHGDPILYLWGETGTGKSHLVSAWALARAAVRELSSDSEGRALAVDDVECLDAEDQVRLFSLVNAARDNMTPVLVAGPHPPARLALRPDLATRLAQGLVLRLLPLSDADKTQAIAIRAEALGVHLPDEVTRFLITHCRRDLPSLLATVDALDAYSLSRKRAVSVPLLRELLAGNN